MAQTIVESLVSDVNLTIKSKNGDDSFTYTVSSIDRGASKEALMALSNAINSIQRASASMVIKSVTADLNERVLFE